MVKSEVFIACGGRALGLAEKLRDEVRTDYCDPRLWSTGKQTSERRRHHRNAGGCRAQGTQALR